jgi:hypothetical protein
MGLGGGAGGGGVGADFGLFSIFRILISRIVVDNHCNHLP